MIVTLGGNELLKNSQQSHLFLGKEMYDLL